MLCYPPAGKAGSCWVTTKQLAKQSSTGTKAISSAQTTDTTVMQSAIIIDGGGTTPTGGTTPSGGTTPTGGDISNLTLPPVSVALAGDGVPVDLDVLVTNALRGQGASGAVYLESWDGTEVSDDGVTFSTLSGSFADGWVTTTGASPTRFTLQVPEGASQTDMTLRFTVTVTAAYSGEWDQ